MVQPTELRKPTVTGEQPAIRCMMRRAFEADTPDHPERLTYVAAIMWPDGEMKQGHFQMDTDRYKAMQEQDGDKCPSWEHIVLDMLSQLVEKLLTDRRNQVSRLIVLPGRRN